MFELSKLKFDERGLIPAVVQHAKTGKVLMLAYMNEESLRITMDEKLVCFWSRSRGELWRKGETSGNRLHLCSVKADCDADTLLVEVLPDGPACHTGSESCFFEHLCGEKAEKDFSLRGLYEMLQGRKERPQEKSYTSYLFESGREKILKKVGEESSEVIIGGMKDSKEEMVYEIADLCYHVLVLMIDADIKIDDILNELASRHIIEVKKKQETR